MNHSHIFWFVHVKAKLSKAMKLDLLEHMPVRRNCDRGLARAVGLQLFMHVC